MQKYAAREGTGARRARAAAGRAWRAVRSTPRSHLYAVLGLLLAMACAIARLVELGLPETDDGTLSFLVVTYSTAGVFALLGYLLGRSYDDVRRLSITDPLTGLFNRRHFGQRLGEETKRAQRYGHWA